MDFADEVKLLGKRVVALKDQIQTEEATKMSFIMPFFQLLGYDVFNPLEFIPEYTADVGIKKGEKVDYAILSDGKPVILVEAKWCGEVLEKHGSQLFRYFGTTKAKFGILTNGVEYRFFTDLEEPNRMDTKPFFIFNMEDIKDQDITELKKFHKSNFDVDKVFNAAEDLKYTNLIKSLLKEQLEEPDENFINYVLGEVYGGRKTQQAIEKFKPVIKKSLLQFVGDLVNDRLTAALTKTQTEQKEPTEEVPVEVVPEVEPDKDNKIVTTEEELEAYTIIKAILHKVLPADRVYYRDTISYFGILCDNKNYKWICRLKLDGANKNIMFPDCIPGEGKYPLETLNSIFDYSDLLMESAKRFIEEAAPESASNE